MNPERIRFSVEVVGITAVVLSLMFVGFELKETRDMNLAELQHDRLALSHSTYLTVLESEPALAHFGKNVYTVENGVLWKEDGATESQRTAGLVLAEVQLGSWEIESRFIEQGFAIRTIEDFESEVRQRFLDQPRFAAVWPLWRYPGDESNAFYRMVNRVISEK